MQAIEDGDVFVKRFQDCLKNPHASVAINAEGAAVSMQNLVEKRDNVYNNALKEVGVMVVEQLILKSTSFPPNEQKGICSKMVQWIAGEKFGLAEDSFHPTLLKFAQDHA